MTLSHWSLIFGLSAVAVIALWAYLASAGPDPFPPDPERRDSDVEWDTFIAQMKLKPTDVGERLDAELGRHGRLLPGPDPLTAVYKSIARHARRGAKRARGGTR